MNQEITKPKVIKLMLEMEVEVPEGQSNTAAVLRALQHFQKVHSVLPLGEHEVQLVPHGQLAYMITEE